MSYTRDEAAVIEAGGARLHLALAPDDPGLSAALSPLVHLLCRRASPLPRLTVAAINDVPADKSPYLAALRGLFEAVGLQRCFAELAQEAQLVLNVIKAVGGRELNHPLYDLIIKRFLDVNP